MNRPNEYEIRHTGFGGYYVYCTTYERGFRETYYVAFTETKWGAKLEIRRSIARAKRYTKEAGVVVHREVAR